MNKELKDKWINALRSGNYKQGLGRLKYNGEYCCLGVLCEISGRVEFDKTAGNVRYANYDCNSVPTEFLESLGLEYKYITRLWRMNDFDKLTFDQIADYLSKEVS